MNKFKLKKNNFIMTVDIFDQIKVYGFHIKFSLIKYQLLSILIKNLLKSLLNFILLKIFNQYNECLKLLQFLF